MNLPPAAPLTRPAPSVPLSPLALTYRRLTGVCESLCVRVAGPERAAECAGDRAEGRIEGGAEGWVEGWVDAGELARRPDLLDAFIDAEAARIQAGYGGRPVPRHVAASRALHDYLWTAALLMSGPWYLEGRVPRLRPRDVRIHLATGAYEVDPAVDAPPGDGDALRAAVADHVRPLLAAIGPALRRGPRALWGMVTDDLVSGIWYLGRALGEEDRAVAAAAVLLPSGGTAPYPGGADFRELTATGSGRTYPTRTRLGCCLYYAIRPADVCLTCPRTGDAERLRRLEA